MSFSLACRITRQCSALLSLKIGGWLGQRNRLTGWLTGHRSVVTLKVGFQASHMRRAGSSVNLVMKLILVIVLVSF